VTDSYEIWMLEKGPNYRRGWLLTRGDWYAADAARLPSGARLVWAGETSSADAYRRFQRLGERKGDDDDEDGPAAVVANRR
jgi:hypothetical protein